MLPPESRQPFFILDNGLNPHIAIAMASLEYPIRSVQDEFKVSPQDTVLDPTIIDHISQYYGFRGVWITKDTSSKRAHLGLIRRRRISVIWIQQQNLSTRQQHRIVTLVIDRVSQDLLEAPGPIHYLITFHGAPSRERITVKVEWRGVRVQPEL